MLGVVQTVLIVFSFVYLLLVFFIFMSKKRISNPESNIYTYLLCINLLTLFVEFALFFLSKEIFGKAPWDVSAVPIVDGVNPAKSFIFLMTSKVFIALILFWFVNILKYTYYLCHYKKLNPGQMKKKNNLINILYIVIAGIILFLPVEYIVSEKSGHIVGLATNFTMLWIMVVLVLVLYYIIRYHKKLEVKKIVPLVILILLMVLAIFIQLMFPELLAFNPVITFITIFMYHTIENPDLKIINELYHNKELVEQNYEDKHNFLFEISGEVRKPLNDITKLCSELKGENDDHILKQGIMLINNMVSQLNFTINNILDISMMDAHKLKLIDTKYSLDKFCNDIIAQIKANINNNVELKVELPNNMPTLYGDYLKLKQILYSLIINPARDKRNNLIEFKVDLIERFDCCRVIFTIIADESQISIEDINNILSATGEFTQNELYNLEKKELDMVLCQKVIKIMGGSLMIKSNKTGSEIKLVIDQRTYLNEEENLLTKYLDKVDDRRKVLVIAQNKKLINDMGKYFKNNNISFSYLLYGKDAIDRIKSGKNYDYIFISNQMAKISGMETLKEIKAIDNFNTPIIAMINEGSENLGKHYIEDGFSNYIIIDNLNEELDKMFNI